MVELSRWVSASVLATSSAYEGRVGWRPSDKGERTHIEDTTDLTQSHPPGSDRFFIALHTETLTDRTSLTPLHELPLDVGHNPAIKSLMRKSPCVRAHGLAHVVNPSIALRADRLCWST